MTPRRISPWYGWLCALPFVAASPAAAAVHLWDIAEVYSNEDGSVQFVELFTKDSGEVLTQFAKLDSTDNSAPLGPVDGPTTNHSYLIATPGFADLSGAVAPDVEMPVAPFFRVDGDTLVFRTINNVETYDSVSFGLGELPLDGVLSLHRVNPGGELGDPPGGLFAAENSPTNYAGEVGLLPEPATAALAAAALGTVALVVRLRARGNSGDVPT